MPFSTNAIIKVIQSRRVDKKMKRFAPKLVLSFGLSALLLAGCSSAASTTSTNNTAVSDLTKKVDAVQQFVDVQKKSVNPGLGTVMIEYSQRFSKAWFAAQAKNWDLVKYQVNEMKEIQETGEIDRPNNANSLKAFEAGFLDPLQKAAENKDMTAFSAAYDKAILGCNSCHTGTKNSEFSSFKFVKIQKPKTPPVDYLDYEGQK
jgi:outer membrane murein-binding lipoprotein Lpp